MCETTAWKEIGNVTSHAATTLGQWVFYIHGNNIEARNFLTGQTTTLSTESWRNVRALLAVPELGKLVAFGYSGVYSIDPRTSAWETLIPLDYKNSVVATCYGKHVYYVPTMGGLYGDQMFCLDLESKISTPVFTDQSWGSTCALVTCLGRIISFHSTEIRSLDPLTGERKQLNNENWGNVVAACELNGFVYCVTSRVQGFYGSIYRINSLTGQYKCLSKENWGGTAALVGYNDKLYTFASHSLYEVSFTHPQSHFSVSELPQFLNTAANASKFVPEVICSTDPETVLVGVGCYGAVFVWNGEGEKYAIKMMYNYTNSTRSESLKQLLQGEVLLHLPCLQHKNIIKLLYAFVHTPHLHFVFHIMATYNALDSSTKLLDINWINPVTKQPNPTQFLVLEYMPCGPLDKYRENLDSALKVLKVCKQIADVIDHLFQNRIVHRDVKLNNFLVSFENGELVVKLADFGLAIQLNDSMTITLDADDCIGGAINYLAPEVRYAPVKGNQRTVCYKYQPAFEIGVVFFELAFRTFPFPTEICSPLDEEVLATQQDEWGSRGFWYPNKFVDLIKRCLSIDCTQRPSTQLIRETMEEILVDVQQIPSLNDTFVLLD